MNDDHYPTLDEEDPTESGLVYNGPVAHEGETETHQSPTAVDRRQAQVTDRHREIARRLIADLMAS